MRRAVHTISRPNRWSADLSARVPRSLAAEMTNDKIRMTNQFQMPYCQFGAWVIEWRRLDAPFDGGRPNV